jgi:hypothetical protein
VIDESRYRPAAEMSRNSPMKIVSRILLVVVAALPLWVAGRYINHRWLFASELALGVVIKQKPFGYTYSIHTDKGEVVDEVDGWIIRNGFLYGSFGKTKYFLIDLTDLHLDRVHSLADMNTLLLANRLPIYSMSDEESIADLKFDRGKNRKYGPPK